MKKLGATWIFLFLLCQGFCQEGIYLRVNQVGYHPDDTKNAVAFSKKAMRESVLLVDATSGNTMEVIRPERVKTKDWGVFTYYYSLDGTAGAILMMTHFGNSIGK